MQPLPVLALLSQIFRCWMSCSKGLEFQELCLTRTLCSAFQYRAGHEYASCRRGGT